MILALDPGSTHTGALLYAPVEMEILEKRILPNSVLPGVVHAWLGVHPGDQAIAIEMIASYGMAVGKDIFETCVWIGRFVEEFWIYRNIKRVYRRNVKLHLCDDSRAKDANIRQALIDRFEPTGKGAVPQIGIKKAPGPLYGMSSHLWAALAVAVTACETWDDLEEFPR